MQNKGAIKIFAILFIFSLFFSCKKLLTGQACHLQAWPFLSNDKTILAASLLALACIFYLSFTWVTRGVETDAKEYAESISSSAIVQTTAKKYANGDATKELFYVDSLKEKLVDRYLDSVKTQTVYD